MFIEQVYIHSKIEGKVHRFPIYDLLPHMYNLIHYQYPPPESTSVTTDEPTMTNHNQPKYVLYITFYSWYCIFYWFGQVYNVSIIKGLYRLSSLPKKPSALHVLLCPLKLWKTFYSLHSLEYCIVEITQYLPFQIGSLTQYIFSTLFHKLNSLHLFRTE